MARLVSHVRTPNWTLVAIDIGPRGSIVHTHKRFFNLSSRSIFDLYVVYENST